MKKKSIDIIDNNYVCVGCGTMLGIVSNFSSYKDVERVNMSTKYSYDRKIHFRDCINQFQGKQNATIDQKVYDKLIEQFELHNLLQEGDVISEKCKNITKEHIYIFLKETGFSKHYEDIVLIHYSDAKMDANQVASFFQDLKSKGIVKNFGVSNHYPSKFNLLQKKLDKVTDKSISLVATEFECSVWNPSYMNYNSGLMDHAYSNGLHPLCWGSLAGDPIGGPNRLFDKRSRNDQDYFLFHT